MTGDTKTRLTRRDLLKLAGAAAAHVGLSGLATAMPLLARRASVAPALSAERLADSEHVHLVCYPDVTDFALMNQLGVNTVLIDLEHETNAWVTAYEAAIRHNLRIIPLLWDQDSEQSVWEWDSGHGEWRLDRVRYPSAVGAKFLGFLKDHPEYFERTFAIYSFHEPLWHPERTGPERMKVFYRQITEDIFPGGQVRVYGEDITMGWEQSDECVTGVLDYETHNVYPFAKTRRGRYRPFDVVNNYYGPPTKSIQVTLRAELACLDARLRRFADAAPAATGRKPKPIVLIQTFTDREYRDLWNRMPTASEMETFAAMFLSQRFQELKGLGWYCFRQAADNYRAWLHKDRYDRKRSDRWSVLKRISERFFSGAGQR